MAMLKSEDAKMSPVTRCSSMWCSEISPPALSSASVESIYDLRPLKIANAERRETVSSRREKKSWW